MVDKFIDGFKHKGLRSKLIKELKQKGITNIPVLEALERVPRHFFVDKAFETRIYEDTAFPIGAGQTISQPYTVAMQTHLLEVEKGMKVLEIGTGSGYQTAILLELGAIVYSIERQKLLYETTKALLKELNLNAKLYYGDGYKGLPSYAPFDRIIVTAGAPFVPEALLHQLKVGGIMVIPVGAGDIQIMTVLKRKSDKVIEKQELEAYRFVPLLEHKAR